MPISLLTLASLASGCQPPLDDLDPDEAGDEAEGTTAAGHDECFEGSDLLGTPGSAYDPNCPVVCAGPSEQALLDIDWTVGLELEIDRESRWSDHHLVLLDAERLLVASVAPESPGVRFTTLSLATGESLGVSSAPELGRLDDIVVGAGGIYAAWRSEDASFVGELTETGEIVWMAPLAAFVPEATQLQVGPEGVAALVPAEQLARFTLDGEALGTSENDSQAFVRREAGGYVGIEGFGALMLNWYDALGALEAEQEVGVDEVDGGIAIDLRMLDGDRVVAAHQHIDLFSLSYAVVSAYERDLGVPLWSYDHHRASEWCKDEQTGVGFDAPLDEPMTSLHLLEPAGEGRMVVAGNEQLGYPFEGLDGLEYPHQPFVALLDVSSDVELVARDRGLWLGEVFDLVVVGDRAIALMSDVGTTTTTLLVRSYALGS